MHSFTVGTFLTPMIEIWCYECYLGDNSSVGGISSPPSGLAPANQWVSLTANTQEEVTIWVHIQGSLSKYIYWPACESNTWIKTCRFFQYMKKHLQSIPIFKIYNTYFILLVQIYLKKVYFGKMLTKYTPSWWCRMNKCPCCDSKCNAVVVIITRFNQI